MDSALLALTAGIPLIMLASAFLPRRLANTHAQGLRRGISGLAAAQLILAVVITVSVGIRVASGNVTLELQPFADSFSPATVWIDGVSALMFLMVSLVGWVICRYSIRYLDGDQEQGNFFRWTAFTLGSVSLMVISGDLLLLLSAWIATSVGLHHLLLHFPDSPAAKRAAWTKFTVIRIGDVSLGFAVLLLYLETGTTNLREIFAAIELGTIELVNLQAAAALLVLAAVVKSAQFPFHTWLPQTLETPTPVSALMHAGIVNAGGYLIVRLNPIVASAPVVLGVLAIVGTITVTYAAMVMLTQTSIKRALAYSTVAQMGFMMLQCGLGAFSAALLHILAHSMYKAHAFLSSGSQIARYAPAAEIETPVSEEGYSGGWLSTLGSYALFVSTMVVGMLGAFYVVGVDLGSKAGGVILGLVLVFALSRWLHQTFEVGDRKIRVRATATAAILLSFYVACYATVAWLINDAVASVSMPWVQWAVAAILVVAGFAILLLAETASKGLQSSDRIRTFYVHASNGFYLDSIFRRAFGSLMSS
ncbi:MAG: proton-conducting transporter membrane subunit [Planctomycetota bacterium]